MKIYDEPVLDGYGHIRLAEDEEFYYECWPQGFNDRLVVVEKNDPYRGYEFGWCFEKRDGLMVKAALLIWDPETQDEPQLWHKRPGMNVRRAPRRDEDPQYNRPRCIHGSYMDEPCARDPYCQREG